MAQEKTLVTIDSTSTSPLQMTSSTNISNNNMYNDNNNHSNNNNDSIIEETPNKKVRKFLWFAPVAEHVHPVQIFFLIFSIFLSLSVIVFLSGTQSFYIYPRIPSINQDEVGDITGSLSFYSEIMSLVMVIIWGVLSDHFEKRWIMCLGLFFMGLPVVVYPYSKNVYPHLLVLRLIFSIGTAASTSMMAAFLTEVVSGQGGWISAMLGTASGLGAIFAVFELFLLPSQLNMHYRLQGNYGVDTVPVAYGIVGGCTLFLSIALFFVLPKSPSSSQLNQHNKRFISRLNEEKKQELQLDSKSRFIQWYYYLLYGFIDFGYKIYRGLLATKDPRIALGYTTSFFARADEVIITNFIGLWVTQYYIDQGICDPNEKCYASAGSSGTLTGIAQAVALASCPFFGAASEYLPKEFAIVIAGVVGAAGCIPFAFSIDPTSNASMAFVVLLAIGQYGMIISGMTMIAGKHIPKEYRGSVAGTYSFFGAVGILIISKVGGVLFDKWMKGAPFLLLGIGHCLVLVSSVAVYIWRRYFYKGDEDNHEDNNNNNNDHQQLNEKNDSFISSS
ncbi:unnamed protein product [Cunninghamella blakesleeana]